MYLHLLKYNQATITALLLLGCFPSMNCIFASETTYSCTFGSNGWNRADWTHVKRPDWKQSGGWVQGADYIENDNPTHTSMIYTNRLQGDVTVSCTMSFLDLQSPSIVIASKLKENPEHRMEYEDHFEIVLWHKGINVWHLVCKDGKHEWTKTAFWTFELKKNEKYKVDITTKGKELTMTVDGHTFGYIDKALPDDFFIGITGCEGINRFYDFTITR